MRRTSWLMVLVAVCFTGLAFARLTAFPQSPETSYAKEKESEPKVAGKNNAPVKTVEVGRNVFVEIKEKKVLRVVIHAKVCLRRGVLEHLLCRRHSKEHEAILTADIDARDLHTALLLAGA